ncbi:MAG: glycosyltransferase, partial [Elusimicrobia bacterium]|nr:glycosyltransferase [Elusimicrobiota bacterium]
AMRKDLIENLSADPAKIRIIPNMVDIPLIKEKSLEKLRGVRARKGTQPLIGAMGGLETHKGFDILLRAFSEYTMEKPARLLIIGEGSQRKNLERLAADLGVKREVSFCGYQANPYPLLKECDLFVLSSSKYEGFPNVILEAMALAVPVISSDVRSGPADIITPGLSGILVSPGSDKAITEAIDRVLGDKNYREELIKGAVERASDFAPEIIIEKYERLFSNILEVR